jgi:hypothetical protein
VKIRETQTHGLVLVRNWIMQCASEGGYQWGEDKERIIGSIHLDLKAIAKRVFNEAGQHTEEDITDEDSPYDRVTDASMRDAIFTVHGVMVSTDAPAGLRMCDYESDKGFWDNPVSYYVLDYCNVEDTCIYFNAKTLCVFSEFVASELVQLFRDPTVQSIFTRTQTLLL